MSRRTTPLYGAPSSRSTAARGGHVEGGSTAGSSASAAGNKTEVTPDVFEALREGRFDAVRRAVTVRPRCMYDVDELGRTPLTAALVRARDWDAVLTHCTRTGSGGAHAHDARRRRTALAASVEWLARKGVGYPPRNGLFLAVSCDMMNVTEALLAQWSDLARVRDARGRSPLHVAMALAPRVTPATLLQYCLLLKKANFRARDADGATPLHQLVTTLVASRGALGLARVGASRRAPLGQLACVIEHAVLEGADALAIDKNGRTPLDIAVRGGLDYLALVRVADAIYRQMVLTAPDSKAPMGQLDLFPRDVLHRVIAHVPPRDAMRLSECCSSLRAIVRTEWLWRHLSARHTMAHARLLIRRDAASLP